MNLRICTILVVMLIGAGVPAQAQEAASDPLVEAARINARLAMEYLKRDQLAVARDKIERALALNPRDLTVQMSAGLVYERLLDTKRAEKHFRLALRADADSPEAQNALGAFLCRAGEFKKGEAMFIKAAGNPLYRTPEVAYTNAGVCARSAAAPERAEKYLRQALTIKAVYPETFVQLAGVLHDRGNHLQARAFIERYLEVAPATPDVLLLGHQIETALNDREAATEFGERLRKEFPESVQLRVLDDIESRNPG
jgi:type IV pilus assembly protein PilF